MERNRFNLKRLRSHGMRDAVETESPRKNQPADRRIGAIRPVVQHIRDPLKPRFRLYTQ